MFAPLLLSAHNPGPMTGSGNNTYLLAGANGSAALVDAKGKAHAHFGRKDEAQLRELVARAARASLLRARSGRHF